jgi:hypothetical protein
MIEEMGYHLLNGEVAEFSPPLGRTNEENRIHASGFLGL